MAGTTLVCAVPAELPKASVSTGAITDALCGRKPEAVQSDPAPANEPVDKKVDGDERKRASVKLTVVRPDRPATEGALTPPGAHAGGVTRASALTRTGAVTPGAEPTPATETAPTRTTDPSKDPAWADALAKARAVPRTRDVITTGDAEGLRKAMLAVIGSDRHMQEYMARKNMSADDLAGVFSRALFKGSVAGPDSQFAVPIPDNPGLIWEMSRHERREFQRSRKEASLASDAATVVAKTELANLKNQGFSETGAVAHLAAEVRSAATELHQFHQGGPLAEYYPEFSRDSGGATTDRAIRTAARDSGYSRDAWEDPVYDDEPYESELPQSEPMPVADEAVVAHQGEQRAARTREQRMAAARREIEARRERVAQARYDSDEGRERLEVHAALQRRDIAQVTTVDGALRPPRGAAIVRRLV